MSRARRRYSAVIIGVLVAVSFAWSAPTAGVEPSTADIQDAIRFRSGFGFGADLPYVTLAATDPQGFPDREWGIPLSLAEAAEMSRRVAVQLSKSNAALYATSLPESAGVFTDQLGGGVPVFLFAGDADRHAPEIKKRLPDGTRFRVMSVPRSLADLEAIRADVNLAKESLKDEGIEVLLTGIHTPSNTLMVGVHRLTAQAEATLRARFGSGISVRDERRAQADVCTFTQCWPPKGGIKVYRGSNACTSAFIASRENDPNNLALLTAGHCIYVGGGAGLNWSHDSKVIGPSTAPTWVEGADADAGFIKINGVTSTWPPAKNLYLTEDEVTRALTVVVETADQNVNDAICRTGITSGKDCGQIVLENVSNESCIPSGACRTIDHTWEVNFDSAGGDSGGPYHVGITTGYGSHIHSDGPPDYAPGNRSWYSPLGWVRTEYFNRYGIFYSYCLSASCNIRWP